MAKKLSESASTSTEPTRSAFHERDAGEFRFACDAHDEVEILVFNCTNRKDAAKKVRDFFAWLRTQGSVRVN